MLTMELLWNILHLHFWPSEKNAYRPHILRREWLVFFLALMLAVEGFLMSNLLVGRQTNEVFLAGVAGTTPMVADQYARGPAAAGVSLSLPRLASSLRAFIQQLMRVVGDPRVATSIIGGVTGLLAIAIFFAFFVHIQIQPKDMIAGAVMVLVLGLLFLYSNQQLVVAGAPPSAETAGAATPL